MEKIQKYRKCPALLLVIFMIHNQYHFWLLFSSLPQTKIEDRVQQAFKFFIR